MADSGGSTGPDLTLGVALTTLTNDAPFVGRVGDDSVVLVRRDDHVFAIAASCSHYHASLGDGLVVGNTIRCPLHHACFSLETGESLRAPAFEPLARWRVERAGDMVFVREKVSEPLVSVRARTDTTQHPSSVVIVGGGAAGIAAADELRRAGFEGAIAMISADTDPPVDRPNLSKDYLAGEAKDDWMPMWYPETYDERRIELVLGSRVSSIDTAARAVVLDDASRRGFGSLLIATGADPVQIPVPGAEPGNLFYLRSFNDSRAIVARASTATRVVVVGASFIGLEVSAALRTRGIAVDVVAPDHVPLERVMGAEVGRFVQSLHEAHGVVFHLGETVGSMAGRTVTLSGGTTLDADFVVLGVGVRPAIALAEKSGLAIDRGIAVNEFLETSIPGIFAAGDVARWPDPHTGERMRVEHWVVAERQGQVAARNMLGARERFDAVPFFWSHHYDVNIKYVGHAERWDAVKIKGSLEARDASISYMRDGRRLAFATLTSGPESLQAEFEFEHQAP